MVQAQQTKTIEAAYAIPSGKEANFKLKFANMITVKSWNKNEILVKTNFTYDNEQLFEQYDEQVTKGSTLSIETGIKKNGNKKNNYNCWSCEEQADSSDNRDCICFKYSYEIYAPENVALAIETISGSIEIPNWKGKLKAKSISGFVDLGIKSNAKNDLSVKSVTGEVYTDLDIRLDKGSTSFSKKMNTSLNGGGELLKVETVSGDIFLRKAN